MRLRYKIKNENKVLQILGVVFTFLTFIFLAFGFGNRIMFWGMIVCLCLTVLTAVLCFIDLFAGTVIVIEDSFVTVTRLFGRRKINIKDIDHVFIEDIVRYRRKPEIHYEYRKKMTVFLRSGKTVVLTDNASVINGLSGFITGERDVLPDSAIPLCQAYEQIMSMMGR